MTASLLLSLFSFWLLLFSSSGSPEPNLTLESLNRRMNSIEQRLSHIEDIMKTGNNEDKNTFRNTNNTIEERLSYLEEVSKTKVLRTCHDLQHYGLQLSGFYFIDPDGESLGYPPIEVYCDFESGFTEVLHDSDNKVIFVPHCEEDHCFQQEYVYTSPMEQITSLIHLSSTCEQEIVYDCFLAPLIYNDVPIGTWFDRSGQEQVYFSGSNYGTHMCSCFSNNSCSGQDNFGNRCNCDSTGVPEWFEDAGIINNMTALPITAFSYGPFQYEMQQASVKVGRLRCKGEVDVRMPPSTCNDLKRLGETRTALYSLQDEDNQGYPKLSYCDMSTPGYEEDMETTMGWTKFSSGPGEVVFSVQHSGQQDIVVGKVITFDREITNQGTAMDLYTGVFTAPVTGLYEFKFSAITGRTDERTDVQIYVNGDIYIEQLTRLFTTAPSVEHGYSIYKRGTLCI